MTKIDLAYLAGVIDSDGTIGIKVSTYSCRVTKDSKQPTYSERVCLKQVEPHAVDLAHSLFGGYRFINDPNAKRGKPLHGWQVTDKKATVFLEAILPFLRIKKSQALTCLELRSLKTRSAKIRVAKGRGHVGAAPRDAGISLAMADLKNRISELNHVGV